MNQRDQYIRYLLWAYFFLVIFEGALRKWIVPGMATPLLVIRDPICIMAIYFGYPLLMRQGWVWGFVLVGVLAIPMAIAFGHGSLPVALFGARILLLHFPMLFLFAAVFNKDDVLTFAKVTLIIAIPMTVLLAMQFYLPHSHIVNVGIGGEGTSVFDGAAGRHRSSGTFSFTNGLSAFYSLAGALFVGLLIVGLRPMPKWIWASGTALVIALPLSISRIIVFSYAFTGIFTIIATGFSPRLLARVIPASIMLFIVFIGASQTTVFDAGMEALGSRWEAATRAEGNGEGVVGVVGNRVVDYGLLSAFENFDDYPLMGMGIGIGTNVGAQLITGDRAFLISEGGWGAMMGELGPLLGLFLLIYRVLFAASMGLQALFANRQGNPLPLILGSVAIQMMFMGNTSQPTALGFIVLSGGLMLAALNDSPSYEIDDDEEPTADA